MLAYFMCDQYYANQREAGQVFALYGGENIMQWCCHHYQLRGFGRRVIMVVRGIT
jgi:hypothetical protein